MNAIQHSNGQDNINVNEISESLTSAILSASKKNKKKLSSVGNRKFSCSAIRIRLEEHLADPSRKQRRCNQFVSEQIVLVCIPVVPAEERSIERVSSWRSPDYVETQVRLQKDWRSVLSRRFSSSIKTTNINTEEIFSVHSTFFFLAQKKILLVLILGRHQHREEEEQFRSKKWPSEHFLCLSIVKKRSISWHFRTSPQQSWSTQIIEDAGKTMKSSEDSSSSICTTHE